MDQSRGRTRLWPSAALVAALLAAGVATLRRWPPGSAGFYPPCPIHQFTGLLCPGCGTTRALSALCHGHMLEALHFNALTTLLLPVALLWGVYVLLQSARGRRIAVTLPRSVIFALLATAALFTVWRNLHLLLGA